MKKTYHLSDSGAMKILTRIGVLLVCAAAAAAATAFLGLENWSRAQYPIVNIPLLMLMALGSLCLLRFGGALDGKADADKKCTAFAIAIAAAAAALWGFMSVTNSHFWLSVPIFVVDLILAGTLCRRFWDMIRNFWNGMGTPCDSSGNRLNFPGQYVLHDVQCADDLTSPFGRVLIGSNTVLFLLTDEAEGYILYKPDGTMEARKQKLLKNESREINLDVRGMLLHGEEGAQRMMRIVEETCAKRGIEVPRMGYSYAMLLPNFEKENHCCSQAAFRHIPWVRQNERYVQYLKRAQTADYFSGRACFNTRDLQELMQQLDREYANDYGVTCTEAERSLIAQSIADACNLVEEV